MKTAISIPDPLFEEAEHLAGQLKISRSRLYAEALREYLRSHKNDLIRETLDHLYADQESSIAPDIAAAQSRVLGREPW